MDSQAGNACEARAISSVHSQPGPEIQLLRDGFEGIGGGMNWSAKIAQIKSAYQARYGLTLTDYKLAKIVTAKCGRTVHHKTLTAIVSGSIPKADVAAAIDELA